VRIVYDARFAADHFVGIGTYAYCLLDRALRQPGDEQWTVLWDPRQPHTRFDFGALRGLPRVEWVERPWAPLSPLGMLAMSAWLRGTTCDVYFSPYHLRPWGARCRCAVTLHDVRPLRMPEERVRGSRALYRWTVSQATRADALVTVSDFSRSEIESLFPSMRGRVHVIRPGIHTGLRAAAPVRPAGVTDGRFALIVGDNRPHKNLEVVVRAWSRLGAGAPLALVGAGPVDPRHPSLADLGRSLGVPVVALGRVAEAELEWLYQHATLLLFPSRYEGFGSPLAEALDHGLPAVIGDTPALRETAGDAALAVESDDPAAWARAVSELASDANARSALAARAIARARDLSYDAGATQLRALLRGLTGARAPDARASGLTAPRGPS
jgi:glycosyltransferase involved in cell wall biosynthesis